MEIGKSLNLYPIDYPFETLIDRVDKGALILNPDFQRSYKWNKKNEEKTSRFIESCLMRIPLPACYFAENDEKKHIVIDGVQRITTIKRFLNDEFKLEGLTHYGELNGKKFSQLGDFQSDLETYTIRCIVLRKDNSKELIKDIFARLNQGAVELTNQEIRHAMYPGTFNDLLGELAKNKIITEFGNDNQKDGLQGEEQVLRFFALGDDLEEYDGKLSKFLDIYMEDNQNPSNEEIEEFRSLFQNTLQKCILVFGEINIFKDMTRERPKQSMVYYDLLMWSFQTLELTYIEEKKGSIEQKFEQLCKLDEFQRTLSGGTQNKSSILRRRSLWREKLNEI
ncbi:GmrSD restriction endonuclease domain-containing protein [Gracilibacillus sp. Marseille-QA3620]